MTDAEKIAFLREALAGLLRQTAGAVDPVHPAFMEAREKAAIAYRETGE